MSLLDTQVLNNWYVATKTKSIRAKPLISIMVDRSVLSKFLLDTIEGKEPLGDGAVICIGEFNDAWQQSPTKLLQKYDVRSIDAEGWMVCEPKLDNSVECHEVVETDYPVIKYDQRDPAEFYIIGNWGETLPDGTKNAQRGVIGDFICRNRTDPTDIWVVQRKIFLNTYSIKE